MGCASLGRASCQVVPGAFGKRPLPRDSIHSVIKKLHLKDTSNDPKYCCQKENDIVGTPEALHGGPSAQCLGPRARSKGHTPLRTLEKGLQASCRWIADRCSLIQDITSGAPAVCKHCARARPQPSGRDNGAQRGASKSDPASGGWEGGHPCKQPPEWRGPGLNLEGFLLHLVFRTGRGRFPLSAFSPFPSFLVTPFPHYPTESASRETLIPALPGPRVSLGL